MLTKENIAALRLWRAAEGKAPIPGGRRPTASERRHAQFRLSESIASGEFPTQIVPAVRRTLQSRYERVERVTPLFTTRKTVRALNVDEEVNIFSLDDQSNIEDANAGDTFVTGGLPTILPRRPYPQIGWTASGKTIRARKIGEAFGLDWEAIVALRGTNVNLIREAFEAFGRHAANQEEIDVFGLLLNSSGFRTGSGQALNAGLALSGNPDLQDPVELADAIGLLLDRNTTAGGQTFPESYGKFVVLTSTANAPKIQQGIKGRRIVRNPGVTSGYSWEETVEVGAEVEVIGSAWFKKLYPSAAKHAIIVPVANEDQLPVLTSNFLEGYEQPTTWVKDSNARLVGGGEVNPMVDGDFDSDSVVTKVRHAHGANFLWTEQIGYTTGAGS